MRIKSFFANTVEEAIRQVRHELGPEAILVNSKKTAVEAQHLGVYEVVACGDAPEYTPEDPGQQRKGNRPPTPALPVDQLSRDVSELKQQMEKLALTLARSGSGMASIAFDAELSRAFTTLTDAELDTELAYDVVSKLSSPAVSAAATQDTLRAELAKLTHVDAQLGRPGAGARVVALVGPPGSGKTSALVKLAVEYGVGARKPVQVLSTDTYRIAAAEELRSYAAILGIGFQVLETPAALAQTLEECRNKDLVLIDTPGLSRNEMEVSADLARVLATHPGIDTHLVLPASMRTADLKRIAGQYAIFRPGKLLFTRLDETETLGPLLSLSVRMELPISFFSSGQRIPEDIEPAAVDTLLDSILGQSGVRESRYVVAA